MKKTNSNPIISTLCLFIFTSLIPGQSISLSGKIINIYDEPLQGATVKLIQGGLSAVTAKNGSFSLKSATTATWEFTPRSAVPVVENGWLFLDLSAKTKVNLTLIDISGRVQKRVHQGVITAGKFTQQVLSNDLDLGIYFLRGTVGDNAVSLKLVHVQGANYRHGAESNSEPKSALAKSSAAADELSISLAGYQDLKVSLDSLNGNLGDLVLLKNSQVATKGIGFIKAYDSLILIRLNPPAGKLRIMQLSAVDTFSVKKQFPAVWEGHTEHVTIARYDGKVDRMFRKFQLVNGETGQPLGAPHFVTDFDIATQRQFDFPEPASKKGINDIRDTEDALALGIKITHENISLQQIINQGRYPVLKACVETGEDPVKLAGMGIDPANCKFGPNEIIIDVDGFPVPINPGGVNNIDKRIKERSDVGITVYAVLLNQIGPATQPDNYLLHPNTIVANVPRGLAAFNLVTEDGVRLYRAAVEFLAMRYSRQDKQFGQISSLIIGNEVQPHHIWYNIGKVEPPVLIDNYYSALRLASLATKKYHKNMGIYTSMDRQWDVRPALTTWVKGTELLEGINERAKAEGNFLWHVAQHPYPYSLGNARWWTDEYKGTYTADKIVFKNVEVLSHYMAQEKFRYKEKIFRNLDLTELGFNDKNGSLASQKDQAAAFACAWHKIQHMPNVKAFLWHRHKDHPDEGNLRFGAITWDEPPQKKFMWDALQKADTPGWEAAFEFAKPILGIKTWDECLPHKDFRVTLPK